MSPHSIRYLVYPEQLTDPVPDIRAGLSSQATKCVTLGQKLHRFLKPKKFCKRSNIPA